MNRPTTIRARRAHPLNATTSIAAIALLALTLLAVPVAADPGAANDNRAPELEGDAARLTVEAGNKLAFHAYAEGVQIYRWTGSAWTFVGPEAILYAHEGDDGGDAIIATHYATPGGPSWESGSGSKVIATRIDGVNVDPTAIDWLLLKAASSTGPGIFDGITFVQRLNTTGGRAPAAPGAFIGQEAAVPYTADYFFYRKAQQ
jgi:hypothetical protein